MQYLMLIYNQESTYMKMTPQEQAAMSAEFGKYTEEITKAGKYRGGNRLAPIASATTVRVRDGKRVATDGPFAETKEQLGGYYLIDANDLDEAILLAAKIPSARLGSVEVRPIVEMGARADSAKG
jgi:hypothetical protein